MACICVIGGGSTGWTLGLVKDLMHVFDEPLEVRLHDLNMKAVKEKTLPLLRMAAKKLKRPKDRILPAPDRKKALRGADAVLITISTGGLATMENDLLIPEKYGIRATVGDTAGPGGWSRAIRNIPVFREFARDFAEICPTAFIANYTNPMAALTATLQRECPNPSVGLCHAYFETKDVIQKALGLADWSSISIAIAGVNHFTWVTDFKIGRQAGYPLLRKKLNGRSLRVLLPEESADEIGIYSRHNLFVELFDAFGYLPYPADRHTSEFVSFALSGNPPHSYINDKQFPDLQTEMLDYCKLKRTSIEYRRRNYVEQDRHIAGMLSGKEKMRLSRSRETGADMIRAYLHNTPFTDAVNALNRGQIAGLPEGTCVETLGCVDGLGVRPLVVDNVPEHLLEVFRPIAMCQKWTTEGTLRGDRDMLLQALYRDPACAALKPSEVQNLARELLAANAPYLPAALRPKSGKHRVR
jgi:alpha-galactosidase/6-phospho-beta-glucosidase family protein